MHAREDSIRYAVTPSSPHTSFLLLCRRTKPPDSQPSRTPSRTNLTLPDSRMLFVSYCLSVYRRTTKAKEESRRSRRSRYQTASKSSQSKKQKIPTTTTTTTTTKRCCCFQQTENNPRCCARVLAFLQPRPSDSSSKLSLLLLLIFLLQRPALLTSAQVRTDVRREQQKSSLVNAVAGVSAQTRDKTTGPKVAPPVRGRLRKEEERQHQQEKSPF